MNEVIKPQRPAPINKEVVMIDNHAFRIVHTGMHLDDLPQDEINGPSESRSCHDELQTQTHLVKKDAQEPGLVLAPRCRPKDDALSSATVPHEATPQHKAPLST